jgi:hypothetical protein
MEISLSKKKISQVPVQFHQQETNNKQLLRNVHQRQYRFIQRENVGGAEGTNYTFIEHFVTTEITKNLG